MNKPILIVMAAGMGSRYGGLKQMDPVGTNGELIIDFSLYDAWKAGFEKVIFVIKREMEADFRAIIDRGAGRKLQVEYAFQDLADLPAGYQVPADRVKPWGTGHAVLAARAAVDQPFAVINADDFYGAEAFQNIYDFLRSASDDEKRRFCMVGYRIENTLTENGSVARGVCTADENGFLREITERTKIQRNQGKIQYFEEDDALHTDSKGDWKDDPQGGRWTDIAEGTLVSMNLWGFTEGMMEELSLRFPAFLDRTLPENPLKGEFFLPFVVDELIREGGASVKVLTSSDKWHGVTYREDRDSVMRALAEMKAQGRYPFDLWA